MFLAALLIMVQTGNTQVSNKRVDRQATTREGTNFRTGQSTRGAGPCAGYSGRGKLLAGGAGGREGVWEPREGLWGHSTVL